MTNLDDVLARQRGVLTRRQGLAGGLGPDAVRDRVRAGHWRRLFGGVYGTAPEPSRGEWRWAAVLRAGPDAILTGRSAAAEVGLTPDEYCPVEVAIPRHRRAAGAPGLVIRRSAFVAERRHPARLPPQTRAEETVLDLCLSAEPLVAMSWITEACARRLVTPATLARALHRRGRAPGRAVLDALIGDAASGCRSVLDWLYRDRVERAHGLPAAAWHRREDDDVPYPEFGVRVDVTGVLQRPCHLAREVAGRLRRGGWQQRAHPCGLGCAVTADLYPLGV